MKGRNLFASVHPPVVIVSGLAAPACSSVIQSGVDRNPDRFATVAGAVEFVFGPYKRRKNNRLTLDLVMSIIEYKLRNKKI